MQIARVRTPNRLNLVVYVQHSRGIISTDADLSTKRSQRGDASQHRHRYSIPVFALSNYDHRKRHFHQPLPCERALIKVEGGLAIVSKRAPPIKD